MRIDKVNSHPGDARRFHLLPALAGTLGLAALASAGMLGDVSPDKAVRASQDSSSHRLPMAAVIQDLLDRETASRPDGSIVPEAVMSRTALLGEMLGALRTGNPADTTSAETQTLRRRAMALAAEVGDYRAARDLAREELDAAQARRVGRLPSEHDAASDFAMRRDILNFGMRAADPKLSPSEEDLQIALADVWEFLAEWRGAGEVNLTTIAPGVISGTLEKCALFLRKTGHSAEAANAYRDITAFTRTCLDPRVGATFTPAYSTACEVISHLEAGDLDRARAGVDAIIAMPAVDRRMLRHGNRSVAFYLNRVLLEHSYSEISKPRSQRRIDLVLPWLNENDGREMNADVASLITHVGFSAASPQIDIDTARGALRHVEMLLVQPALLAPTDKQLLESHMKQHPNARVTPYISEKATASLLVTRFRLATKVEDFELAKQTAETFMTKYPDSPSLNIVAPWYKREVLKEAQP